MESKKIILREDMLLLRYLEDDMVRYAQTVNKESCQLNNDYEILCDVSDRCLLKNDHLKIHFHVRS